LETAPDVEAADLLPPGACCPEVEDLLGSAYLPGRRGGMVGGELGDVCGDEVELIGSQVEDSAA